ncbi:18114_t:CDS:1, partial [Racocetra persica]
SKSVKRFFEILSLMAKKNHLLMHPDYKFQPDKSKKQKGLKFREFCLKKTINKDKNSKKSHDLTVTTTTTIRSITDDKQQSFDNLSKFQQETLLSPKQKALNVPQSSQMLDYGLPEIDPFILFSYPWAY